MVSDLFYKFTSQSFSTFSAMTSHKQMQKNANMNLYTLN